MDRRALLSTGAAACTLPLAGCGTLRTDLDAELERENYGVFVQFGPDAPEDPTATLGVTGRGVTDGGLLGLRLSATARRGTHLDAFEYGLFLGPRSDPVPTRFHLAAPEGGPWPDLSFDDGSDGRRAAVAASDLGRLGDGTVSLDFLVEPLAGEAPFALTVDASLTLSGTLRTFGCETNVGLELPTPNDR